ncbi:MAG TPA: hypothetical protein VJN22_02845 [Candidatus Eremiobacteraceae bacterium]|nr:hypothetical protein [Candidatus Eremiobacteraceae bacterium]
MNQRGVILIPLRDPLYQIALDRACDLRQDALRGRRFLRAGAGGTNRC